MKRHYTDEHAAAGIDAKLPDIETWPNQFPGYEIEIDVPEFTSVCPKTGLPDFGVITVNYVPDRLCLELKSFKMYSLAYRDLGIFQENVVNCFLRDIVRAAKPVSVTVTGEFAPRGGLGSRMTAKWEKGRSRKRVASDREKIEELTTIIQTVRDRVRARYPKPEDGELPQSGIRIFLPDLLPVVHARDAAQAKIAAIGSVNPRAGGAINKLIQLLKKTVARSLQWFVRDQIAFNRESVSAVEAVLEALNEQNRILLSIAAQTNEQLGSTRAELDSRTLNLASDFRASLDAAVRPLSDQMDLLKSETTELKDIRKHWIEWRADWERKLALNEIQFLRSVADVQGSSQHRVTLIESNFRDLVKAQYNDYLGAMDRATIDIQRRLWSDLEKARGEFERLIHSELRVIRQRGTAAGAVPVPRAVTPAAPPADFDYARFAERFRGSEEYVSRNQAFYKPFFEGCASVLDIGCGRGEFLETMREAGIAAQGIDLSEESVAHCRSRGLQADTADLFAFLNAQPDAAFDGIFSSQVVEHLAPEALPRMIQLCAAKLGRGGVLAIETPNPECLAIFATHFYLDPTHTRPLPPPLLSFYLEEAGLGMIQIHALSPAAESFPEVSELPTGFREKFFGGLDYAIIGRKL